MARHPVIEVPDVGLMDHAWDALGVWTVSIRAPQGFRPVLGALVLVDWDTARLELAAEDAFLLGWPMSMELERVGTVRQLPHGGGALGLEFTALEGPWHWAAVFWPGEMQVQVRDGAPEEREPYPVVARRPRSYYLAKYPAPAA